jgi:hypothetical protein
MKFRSNVELHSSFQARPSITARCVQPDAVSRLTTLLTAAILHEGDIDLPFGWRFVVGFAIGTLLVVFLFDRLARRSLKTVRKKRKRRKDRAVLWRIGF